MATCANGHRHVLHEGTLEIRFFLARAMKLLPMAANTHGRGSDRDALLSALAAPPGPHLSCLCKGMPGMHFR